MKYLLFLVLTTLAANCFAQDFPPPPPPPPPPPDYHSSPAKFDINIHKPICKTLMGTVNNECDASLRNLSGTRIHFNLPERYIESNDRFKKNEDTWIEVTELPKVFRHEFFVDSLRKNMSKIENAELFEHKMTINGNPATYVEAINKEWGFAIGILVTGSNKNDYLVKFIYDLTDNKSVKEINDCIYSICYKDVAVKNPLEEVSVTIDTSFTHFIPQTLGKNMILFTSKESAKDGLYSLSPKFQLSESDEDLSTEQVFTIAMSALANVGYECTQTNEFDFKSNGIYAVVREITCSRKTVSIELYMYMAIIKTGYSTITFSAMTLNEQDRNKYKEIWEKSLRSIKRKKK